MHSLRPAAASLAMGTLVVGLNERMLEDGDNLIASARCYFADDFPNPSRVGCPNPTSLAEMADAKRLPDASLRAHLLGCSECFEYLNTLLTSRRVETPASPVWGEIIRAVTGSWRPLTAAALFAAACVFVWSVWPYVAGQSPKGISPPAPSGAGLSAGVDLPAPTPAAVVTPTPPESVKLHTPDAPPKGNPRTGGSKPPALATHLVRIDLSVRLLLRGSDDKDDEGPIRVTTARNYLSIRLPEDSPRGEYTVSLVDAFGETVIAGKARSRDGKRVALVMDMRRLPSKHYRLCISHAEGIPSCFPLSVSGDG